MMRAAITLGFDEHGFHRIDLFVLDSNTRALEFYVSRLGFRVEGLNRDIICVNASSRAGAL